MGNKNILLTGGTGFLGSFLAEELLNNGFKVILLKRSYSDVSKISGIINQVKCYDVDKIDGLENIFENEKIDIIIHTATDYGRRDGDFYKIIESNLLLPIQLLEFGIKYGTKYFINTDTFRDKDIELPVGLSYYSYSKKDFLQYAKKIIAETNTHLINIKLEHLYGPKDNETKFMPYIIKTLLKNVESIDLTKGEQKKDFIYIKDAVSAYVYTLNNLNKINNSFEEFDLGTGETLPIKDLIHKINDIIKSTTKLNFGKLDYRKGESMDSKADTKKLNVFGWTPKYTIDSGISETIDYFREHNL